MSLLKNSTRLFDMSRRPRMVTAYRAANAARDARNWPLSAELFGALVAEWPLEAAAWVQLGHSLKESGRLVEAERAYAEALRLEPGTADTELHLFHLRKRLSEAGVNAGPGVSLERPAVDTPHEATGVTEAGVLDPAAEHGDWSRAAELCARIVGANPTNMPAWVQLGHALKESGRRVDAEHAYRMAIKLRPGDADAHLQLGHLLRWVGRRAEALASYQQALLLDPALGDARTELVQLGTLSPELAGIWGSAANPVFVIRGDIISTTGYAKAARAMAKLLSENFAVVGLSIHEDPADCAEPFPGPLVSDDDVIGLATRSAVVVVHHTTPDQFMPFPHARNIIAFYWETRAQPRQLQWAERLAFADAVWAPTRFVADFVTSCGYQGPIVMVPWAHDFGAGKRPRGGLPTAAVHHYDGLAARQLGTVTSVAALRRSVRTLFLAVQSLAPRKGLPLLLAGWREHVAATPNGDDLLLLKLNFRHAHGIESSGAAHLAKLLRTLGMANGKPLRLALLDATLTEDELAHLMGAADCYVTTTLGEGFGGPVIEALTARVPVIAPRHTGLCDLLAEDYPLTVAASERCVALMDNMSVYPHASTWFVPEPGSLSLALARFSALEETERSALVDRAIAHAAAFCGVDAVRRCLASATAQLNVVAHA
jgi:tetratricopeptide (TPR) repeat protein